MPASIKRKRKATPKPLVPDFKLRGAPADFYASTEHEVIVCGPADSAKTFAGCLKAHAICERNPGAQGAIVRKAFNSLAGTVVKTFTRITQGRGIQPYGGENPTKFNYPNGSAIWLGGMDNPDRVLSSERDFIFVPQAEELTESEWEVLGTRCTGRGAVVTHAQIFGDCNPAGSKHWIRTRKSLRLLNATHKDNPELFDDAGEMTQEGVRRISILEASLTGVRRKRLLEGIWATAEGAVYDMFDAAVHMQERPSSEMKRWHLAIDEGYTNPAVILLVGEDSDGRLHVAREFYKRQQLQAQVIANAKSWFTEFHCDSCAVDESAAGLIADLNASGVRAAGAKGRVLDGIGSVQNLLAVKGDGRPRLTIDPSCVNVQNEFESYKWKPEKDMPEKEDDHAMDALRYLADFLKLPTGAINDRTISQIKVGANASPNRFRPTFIPRRLQLA